MNVKTFGTSTQDWENHVVTENSLGENMFDTEGCNSETFEDNINEEELQPVNNKRTSKTNLLERQIQIQLEHLDIVKKSYDEQVRHNANILNYVQKFLEMEKEKNRESSRIKVQELELRKLELDIQKTANEIKLRELNNQ